MISIRAQNIIEFLKKNGESSSKDIFEGTDVSVSLATFKRDLAQLVSENFISIIGQGKATKYIISPAYRIIQPIDLEGYFEKEIDERDIIRQFNFSIISELLSVDSIFNDDELSKLDKLQSEFQERISHLSDTEFNKEFERLAIDLSWKSSQIEGNTYSLLETERLLKEKETASGKSKDEATMLLNHKDAVDFILANPDYLYPLSVTKIEDIHSILIKELNVEKNLRKRRVGITGTNYQPLDNEFQILEALENTCKLINKKENVFEKALIAIIMISYIQPFVDGNKRTARITGNAILMNKRYCPLSYRTVNAIDYKKAMLLFYEQNNISAIKKIFIEQYDFAVKTYF